ncbi:MAG: FHA domain-containing protein [Planctomycetota bacterium]|nr:MAG: FHA domain-containing protein [Planctomycetota bacterium]
MPRLIVMHGAEHSVYEVTGKRVTLGRHADNDVVIRGDEGVSRFHCSIDLRNGAYTVKDRGSRRGTYLNGTRLAQRTTLEYGDRLRLGSTVVIFTSTGRRQNDEKAARRLTNLLILQEVAKELNSETDLDSLLELIMDTAIGLIQAERGFLILVKGGQLEFRVARNIASEVVQSPQFQISNNVIRRVVKTGEPILTSNAQQDLGDMKSIAELELRQLLCVPLRVKGKVLGTVYLDSRAQGGERSQFDEVGRDLLMAFSDQAAIAIENARLRAQEREKEAILSELRVASRIQLALLPREDPVVEGLEVAGRMKTAQEVGGDYYDFIRGGSGRFYAAIGDVSGKGVPAGLVMVMARSILRSLVARGWRPQDVLRETNRLLKADLKPGMFMTMLLLTADGSSGRLLMAGCGHERPLLYRAATRRVERLDLGGIVLGVVDELAPHLTEEQIVLAPGDHLLLYTDGVTEATSADGALFGIERLEALLQRHGHRPPKALAAAVEEALAEHSAGALQHDDITLVALRRPVA